MTVYVPPAFRFTVDGLHVALVITESSLATVPGRDCWASLAMQAFAVHAAAAEGAESAAASGVPPPAGLPFDRKLMMTPATTRAPMTAKTLRTQCEPLPCGERCPAGCAGRLHRACAGLRHARLRLHVRSPRRAVPPAKDLAAVGIRVPSRRQPVRVLRRLRAGRPVLLTQMWLLALLAVRIPGRLRLTHGFLPRAAVVGRAPA